MIHISDKAKQARLTRSASSYKAYAQIMREMGRRLADHIRWMNHRPDMVLDLGAGPTSAWLATCCDQWVACDLNMAMCQQNEGKAVCGRAESLPFAKQSFDWVVANAVLPYVDEVAHVMQEVYRVLKPGGFFFFSHWGPDTLAPVRALAPWAVNTFEDMHTLGDRLKDHGFHEVVLDRQMIRVHYPSPRMIWKPWQATGSWLKQARPASIPWSFWRHWDTLYRQTHGDHTTYPIPYELIFGHAMKPTLPTVSFRDRAY